MIVIDQESVGKGIGYVLIGFICAVLAWLIGSAIELNSYILQWHPATRMIALFLWAWLFARGLPRRGE